MKQTILNRILSLLLCLVMVFSILPASALADDESTPAPTQTAAPASETQTAAGETTTPTGETLLLSGEATPMPGDSSDAEETPAPSATPAPSEEPTPTSAIATEYTVSFVVNGEAEDALQQTLKDGSTATKPADPAVPSAEEFAGQSFLYWTAKGNEAYDFSTPVTSNLVLYAVFGVLEAAPETLDPDATEMFALAGGILPETTPLWTYTFVVDGSMVSTQTVATGDTLDWPEAPSAPAGQRFLGWFAPDATLFSSFGVQTVTFSGSTTLTAVFEDAYYAFFYNQYGAIIETRSPDATGAVATSGIASLQLSANEALLGWSLTPGGTADVGASVTVTGASVNLYPIIADVIWITFDSNGGTYVAPMHITPGTVLTQSMVNAHVLSETGLSAIQKAGFTFSNWSGYAFGGTPSTNVALHANWTANSTTAYKLVYWIENADDADYSFEKSVTKTGISDAVITLDSADVATTNLNAGYRAYFNNGTYTTGQTIDGDGSAIVNVYFTRKTYTLTFKSATATLFTQTYKYDQDISAVWNVAGILNLSTQGYVWKSSITNNYYTYLMKMPGGNLTMTATLWSGSIYSWSYYLETLDGTAATAPAGATTTTDGGITYYLLKTVTIKGGGITLTYDEDYFPITGFYQRDASVPSFTANNGAYSASLFYRRASYNLTFINGDTTNTVSGILYGQPIESNYYVPSIPTGLDSSYLFGGWYTTKGAFEGSDFTWAGATMPAKNVVLYSKWTSPWYSGTAYLTVYGSSGGSTFDLGTLSYGSTISTTALAAAQTAAEAYKPHTSDVFGGWYILINGSLVLYNPSLQIYEDVVLYPIWISGVNYGVTYNLGEATGTAPVDSERYASGGQAQVKACSAPAVTAPTDKVFIGWRSSVDGKLYYPNSAIMISEDTVLTANWAYAQTLVSIAYSGNGGALSGGETSFLATTRNNTYHTVQGNAFLYTGKVFTGWNTAADGSGTSYAPGESVLLGVSVASAPGTMYAIWRDQTFEVTVSAAPASGVATKTGAGTYVYHTDATVSWTLSAGYEIASVTDNGSALPAASYAGNSYTVTGIQADHTIVINTVLTLFSLTYNGNGGTLSGGNTSYSATKTYGSPFEVDANTFARSGYYFLGWSTNEGAAAPDAAYAVGASVSMPAGNLTLYAVWAAKTALTLTANSATQNYDGATKSVSGISASVAGLTIEGTTAGVTGTNPGVYPTSFINQSGLVLKSGGVDVTERYTVSWANGSLTVNPQVTYRVSVNNALIGTEWVAYGTGDATYGVTPPSNVTVSGVNYYWLGTYSPAAANDLTANTTVYASYTQNKTLVITADSASYVYNGTARAVTTGTISVSGVTVSGYTVSGSGTNVGTYTTAVTLGSLKIMSGATDVTNQYDVSTTNGTLTITPATMSATASGYSGIYDNMAHGITVTPVISGSTVRYSLTSSTNPAAYALSASPTATDVTPGTVVYFVVTNPNYNSVFGSEEIVINPRVIALTTASDTKVYNGTALTNSGWTEDGDSQGFVAGQGFATAAANGTITNVGTTTNGFAYSMATGTKQSNYTIEVTAGVLEITKSKALSVDAADYIGKYDGAAHGATAIASIPAGTTIRYSVTFSTDPAAYTLSVSPTATHVDESRTVYFAAINANYEPAFGDATITVTPRTVVLTAATDTKVYNGSALTNSSVTVSGDGFLAGEGYLTAPTASDTITNVGSTANTVVVAALNAATKASDYTVTKTAGTLSVAPATLTVAAVDQQLVYPASRPATGTLTFTLVGGNVAGETPAYSGNLWYDSALAADPLSPGVYTDAIVGGSLELVNNGKFLAANYTLVVEKADLKVVNGAFAVDLTGGSWVYDGTPHGTTLAGTKSGDMKEYFVSDGACGWTSIGATPPTITNVNDGPVTVKVIVTRAGFDPAEDTATLTITPAATTAASSGYTGIYDNVAHGIIVTPTIPGSTVRYSLASSTNPAAYVLTTSATATDVTTGTAVYFVVTNPNYKPVFGSEQIVINPRVVALTTASDTKVYNGLALTNSGWTEDGDSQGFVAGQGFAAAAANGTITNVGTASNGFAYKLTAGTKQSNYTIDVTEGVLEITRASTMTVAAPDYIGKYDGAGHGVNATASVAAGTVIRYSLTSSTDAAAYSLSASPAAKNVSESKTIYFVATNPNFEPAFGSATVTITSREVTIDTASAEKGYDGTALKAGGWSVDPASDGFVGKEGFATAATAGTITNAGTADNGFTYTLKSGTLSENYTITVAPGTLTVRQRTVMIAASNADKNYGAADPAFAYTVKTGMIGATTYYPVLAADLAGITVSVSRMGYDSEVGQYPDVLVPSVSATPAVENNYLFSTETADFTINPQVVYNRNTTDKVTGFPGTAWYDLGTNATVATASGVKRPGYTLTGWQDVSTGELISLGGTIPAIDANHTLNALWEIAYYKVHYVKGTTDSVRDMPENLDMLQYGENVTIAGTKPYHSGYRFAYWKTISISGTETIFDAGSSFKMPDNDVILVAVWQAEDSPVYYHANGGAGGTVEGGRYATDSLVTVEGNLFSRPGYHFLGWSEKSASAGVSRQPGSTFTMPPRQVNFYAQWEQESYMVTYIVSGGTGELDGSTPYASYTNLHYGDTMPIPADPSQEGYTFEGWTTSIPATVPVGGLVVYGTMRAVDRDMELIQDSNTPLAGSAWALLNLILAISSALASILMLVGYIGKKHEKLESLVVRETKKHGLMRILTLVPGIGGILAFLLTENMNNPMVFTDRWTWLMIAIAAVQLLLVVLGAKKEEEPKH